MIFDILFCLVVVLTCMIVHSHGWTTVTRGRQSLQHQHAPTLNKKPTRCSLRLYSTPFSSGSSSGLKKSFQFTVSPATSSDLSQELILHHFYQIQGQPPSRIAIIGTSELNSNQNQMIELLSYALVLSGNHVITSGGGNGTNLAVIRGALRARNPDLLTVLLPQSLHKQPIDLQSMLSGVINVVELPENDGLGLREAAQLCNYKLLSLVDKVIVFVYHDSFTILNPLEDFNEVLDIVRFYLD